jgi:hypothetical protein
MSLEIDSRAEFKKKCLHLLPCHQRITEYNILKSNCSENAADRTKIHKTIDKKQFYQNSLEILEREYPDLCKLLAEKKNQNENLVVDANDSSDNDFTDDEGPDVLESVECHLNDNVTTIENPDADEFSEESSEHSEESVYSGSMSSDEESDNEFSD